MIYGEGERAFRRLQEEIIKSSTDRRNLRQPVCTSEPFRRSLWEEYLGVLLLMYLERDTLKTARKASDSIPGCFQRRLMTNVNRWTFRSLVLIEPKNRNVARELAIVSQFNVGSRVSPLLGRFAASFRKRASVFTGPLHGKPIAIQFAQVPVPSTWSHLHFRKYVVGDAQRFAYLYFPLATSGAGELSHRLPERLIQLVWRDVSDRRS